MSWIRGAAKSAANVHREVFPPEPFTDMGAGLYVPVARSTPAEPLRFEHGLARLSSAALYGGEEEDPVAGMFVRPEDYSLGSDAANLAAAFAAGVAGGIPVRLDGAYSIATALSPIDVTTGRLTVLGSGTITCTANLGSAVTIQAPYPAAVFVSAIAQTMHQFPGVSTIACAATRITALAHGCAIGDLIKIVGDDQAVPQSAADHRRGEFAYVADVAGNDLYIAGALLESYTTNVRIVRVRTEARLVWDGPTFAALPDNPSWSVRFLTVRGFAHPRIRSGFRDGYSLGLDLSSCFMAEADVEGIQMLNRVASASSQGYLVQDSASAMSRIRIRGVDARHAYTCTTPTSAPGGSPYLFGRSRGSVVSGLAVGCSSAAFDAHTDGLEISFVDISTAGGRLGEAASGTSVQLRGIRNRAIDCLDRSSTHGLTFYAQVANDCVECEAINFAYVGAGDGIRVNQAGAPHKAKRPLVKGGRISTSAIRSVVAWECDGMIIDDLVIAPIGIAAGTVGILLGGGADVLVRRVTFDLTGFTGTNFRPFAFDTGSTGNRLVVESAQVVGASGKLQAWFSGGNTSGDVVLADLRSDAVPSGGNVINGGSLTSLQLLSAFRPPTFAVSGLPSAVSEGAGAMVWTSNGNSGAACLAVSDGAAWRRVVPGAAVSAT